MALFDYVLSPENRSRRTAFLGALRPIIVLGALIAFIIALAVQPRVKPAVPAKSGPTEVKFVEVPASANSAAPH